jgi:hypothetical protein
MEAHPRRRLALFFVLWFSVAGLAMNQGCAAAVATGAGAAGVAYFTSRGAKALVEGSMEDVAARTQVAMSQKDIPITEKKSEKGGAHREFKGAKGDLDVTVTLDRNDDKTTNVEVSARRNLVTWDKDYAKSLLTSIITKA